MEGGRYVEQRLAADFGGNHKAAVKAAATIHYYGMNRQCFVNRNPGPPVMRYWLAH